MPKNHHEETRDITIGAPYLNRNSEEDLNVVGLFLEPLPIRIRYPPLDQSTHQNFLSTVKHCSRQALSHAVPWNQLLSHLNIEPEFPNHPLFDVMVTFHEADHAVTFPIEGV
jgi:hypothetical protein